MSDDHICQDLPEGFDPDFYLLVHGDVAEAGADPADHYRQFGRHDGRSGIPPGRLHPLEAEIAARFAFMQSAFNAISVNGIRGDYVEFGVAHGKTMWAAWRASRALGLDPMMWAFDSFAGLPSADNEIDRGHPAWKAGRYAVSEDRFRRNLQAMGIPDDSVVTVPGFFDDTLAPHRRANLPSTVAFAYVDCDMYRSTVTALDYLADVLVGGSIIAFDDYFCWSGKSLSGEQCALDEFSQRRSDLTFHPYLPIGWHGMSFFVMR